jgi:hypothetical protein
MIFLSRYSLRGGESSLSHRISPLAIKEALDYPGWMRQEIRVTDLKG